LEEGALDNSSPTNDSIGFRITVFYQGRNVGHSYSEFTIFQQEPTSTSTLTPTLTPSQNPTIQPSPSITPTPTEYPQNSSPSPIIDNSFFGIPLMFLLFATIIAAIVIITILLLALRRKKENKS
jgi:hypothetical protein